MNFRLLLIRAKIHILLGPFRGFFLKAGNFIALSHWIAQQGKFEFNDYYNPRACYADRYKLCTYIIEKEIGSSAVLYLEFGVADGETTAWWAENLKHPLSRICGFDTFEGLPEDWGSIKKGAFSNNGNIPTINDDRITFYKGLFQETLPGFLTHTNTGDKKKIILLDADLYSATLFVLASLAPYLQKDDILIFDEFPAPRHEFLAYRNFSEAFSHITLEPFAAANNYMFVAFRVL